MFTVVLNESARPALRAHFIALAAEDRRLRFGCSVNDAFVERYVDQIDFTLDAVFGVNAGSGSVEGVAHLAMDKKHTELGVSVLQPYRGRGIGTALVSRAAVHARNRKIEVLFMQCLSENRPVMRIARSLGMRVVTAGPESEGSLVLAPPNAFSIEREILADRIALCDAALRATLVPRAADEIEAPRKDRATV
jgi:GNAT superfamily N-acetyltransferase